MDRQELKVQALLEKISSLENEVADLRVELTVTVAEKKELVSTLNKRIDELEGGTDVSEVEAEPAD